MRCVWRMCVPKAKTGEGDTCSNIWFRIKGEYPMKLKTSLLTLALVASIFGISKWMNSEVSATTMTSLCGTVSKYTPATATTAGLLVLSGTNYVIAPGTVIIGEAIIKTGGLCLNATLDGNGQIVSPTSVGGSTVTVCGIVNNFKAPAGNSSGSISIGSSNFTIEPFTSLSGQMQIAVGSNMCMTATLNGAGRIIAPTNIQPNINSVAYACGTISAYAAPTSSLPGLLTIGGMSLAVGPGVNLGSVSVGSSRCLAATLDVNGQMIAPSSLGANPGNETKLCGIITTFKQSSVENGLIVVGGVKLPIAKGAKLFDPVAGKTTLFNESVYLGSNRCIYPTFANGLIVGGDVNPADPNCLQFFAPLISRGEANGSDAIFLLNENLNFTVVSGGGGAAVFPLNDVNFGLTPEFRFSPSSGLSAFSPSSTVRALSCTENFWDLYFYIATKGNTEGDMIKIYLTSPSGTATYPLAMFTVQSGGLVVNQLNSFISLYWNSNGPHGVGSYIPMPMPAGHAGNRTLPMNLIFSMDPGSVLNGCYQLGVDIKRVGGAGSTSFIPSGIIVKRMGEEKQDLSLNCTTMGTFPTGRICDQVCSGCSVLPQVTPTPTPSATPTPSVTPTPTPTPSVTPTPTPSITPTPTPTVTPTISPTLTPTPPPMPFKCDTLCYRTPTYYLLNINSLPSGSILIGGVNNNALVSIQRSKDQIRLALQGGSNPLQQLNQQFVTMQISFAATGGSRSPVVFNSFWSPLRCSGLEFTPVTLSNGVTLSPDSLLDTFYQQVFLAIKMNRTADMPALTQILSMLNGRC